MAANGDLDADGCRTAGDFTGLELPATVDCTGVARFEMLSAGDTSLESFGGVGSSSSEDKSRSLVDFGFDARVRFEAFEPTAGCKQKFMSFLHNQYDTSSNYPIYATVTTYQHTM